MFNFREWLFDEKKNQPTVNPQIGQWETSVEKLKTTLEKLKKVLKDKKIDIVIDKKGGKPEVKVKTKEEPRKVKSEPEKPDEKEDKDLPKNPYITKNLKPSTDDKKDKDKEKEEPKSPDKTP